MKDYLQGNDNAHYQDERQDIGGVLQSMLDTSNNNEYFTLNSSKYSSHQDSGKNH